MRARWSWPARAVAALLTGLLALPLCAGMARAGEPESCGNCVSGVGAGSGGLDVEGHGGGASPGNGGSAAGGPGGPIFEYTYTPACAANQSLDADLGFTEGVDCQGAHACPDPQQTRTLIARREVTGSGRGPWQQAGSACLSASQLLPYDPAAAAAFALDYFRHLPLPEPGIHIQPAGRTLVNLPTIVFADPPPAGEWTVDHPPFPTVRITATPRWSVDFGEAVLTSQTPGRPYDGTDPRQAPGYYLAHRYAASADAAPITITARWFASFTLGDDPTAIPLTETVDRSSTATVAVDEAGAVLTGND